MLVLDVFLDLSMSPSFLLRRLVCNKSWQHMKQTLFSQHNDSEGRASISELSSTQSLNIVKVKDVVMDVLGVGWNTIKSRSFLHL